MCALEARVIISNFDPKFYSLLIFKATGSQKQTESLEAKTKQSCLKESNQVKFLRAASSRDSNWALMG